MKISDFKAGEKAYVFIEGSRTKPEIIKEVEVMKIGRKYVTVGRFKDQYKETGEQSDNFLISKDYIYFNERLFHSNEDINDYKEKVEKMIKKGTLVTVNPDLCLTRYSQFAIMHPKYMLRWSYSNYPKHTRTYIVIGVHKTRTTPIVVVQDTTCKTKKYNPIFFIEINGVKEVE